MRTLLSLDMSTTCTGWSTFNMDTEELISYGIIKPSTKFNGIPISKYKYPMQQLCKMVDISFQIRTLIENHKPDQIVIEEIAGSKNRIGQKVLDGLHWIVLMHIQEYIPLVEYFDVGGSDGWRPFLGIRLSDADKLANKEAKKLNPKLVPQQRLPIYGWKDLACRYVNSLYHLSLNPQERDTDGDIGDSIAIGSAYIKKTYTKQKG